MSFIPEKFNTSGADGAYFKPVKGKQNRVRILCNEPLLGFVQWTNQKKPARWALDQRAPDLDFQQDTKPKKFIAVTVWNYEAERIQVWEITQRTLQDTLSALGKDEDFGHPMNYDLKISRKGEGLETSYSMVPIACNMSEEVKTARLADVKLEALLTSGDPFA